MRAAPEEFLYFLLWTADGLTRPTWRNFNDSFESWAYRNGLGGRMTAFARQKVLERVSGRVDTRCLYRLTEKGRLLALQRVDPMQRWSRGWDGAWRLAVFDVPEVENCKRVRLRRRLKEARFGYLQRSVWLSPDPLDELRRQLRGPIINAECLTLFEGRPCGGESDEALVRAAWDFAEINRCYDTWSKVMDCAPRLDAPTASGDKTVRAWAAHERMAWHQVVRCDPFLPAVLLPENYPGRAAWRRRQKLLTEFGGKLWGY